MATTKSESTIVGRQELTKRIAAEADLTQKKAGEVLEVLLDGIKHDAGLRRERVHPVSLRG